ncbi:MAG: hypothetical protein RIC36_09610 [Rhodospirillales bacterium]
MVASASRQLRESGEYQTLLMAGQIILQRIIPQDRGEPAEMHQPNLFLSSGSGMLQDTF